MGPIGRSRHIDPRRSDTSDSLLASDKASDQGALCRSGKGRPKGSPLWSSTMSSYKVIPRCHRYVTPRYRQLITEMALSKRVAHLTSPREMAAFLDHVRNEFHQSSAMSAFRSKVDIG